MLLLKLEAGESLRAHPGRRTLLTRALPRFLLKYIARDEVDLLGRGTGGVVEIRFRIDQYDEKSPLYGFVQYRRRKVLLKYVPEGMSRLLQGMAHHNGLTFSLY